MIDLMGAILERGGPVLWLLVVLSLAVVATGLERFWWWSTVGSEFRLHRYRRDGGGPQLDRWRHILREEGHAMAFTVIERDLRRGVSFLGFVVGAAPMLGILGTVHVPGDDVVGVFDPHSNMSLRMKRRDKQ